MPNVLEQVLESISDAVSTLVMFAAEADEHDTAIPDLTQGADVLAAAVKYLTDLGAKSGQQWAKIGRQDMRDRMSNESKQILESCDLIVKSIRELKANPFLRPAKKTVLSSCKVIMKHTVSLLQFADLYEIQRIIREANEALKYLKEFSEQMALTSGFINAVTLFVQTDTELVRLCYRRVQSIETGEVSVALQKVADVVKAETENYVNIHKEDITKKPPQISDKNRATIKTLLDSFNKIIELVRKTSNSPFDLSLLDSADLLEFNWNPNQQIQADLLSSALKIAPMLDDYKRRLLETGNAGPQLSSLKEEIEKQISTIEELASKTKDPVARQQLEFAANRLRELLEELVRTSQKAKGKNLDDAFRELDDIIQEIKSTNAKALQIGGKEALYEKQRKLEGLLEQLGYAARIGNTAETVELLKTITKEIKEQGEFAQAIALSKGKEMTPLRKERIQGKLQAFDNMPQILVATAKDVLQHQNNPELLEKSIRQLERNINETKLVSADLADMCSMGTEAQVLSTSAALDLDSKKLQQLFSQEVVDNDSVARVMKVVAKNADLIHNLASEVTSNPTMHNTRKAIVKETSEDIPKHATNVITAIRNALLKPSPETKTEVIQQAQILRETNAKFLENALLNTDDQMATVEVEMMQQLDNLKRLLAEGTEKEINKALEQVEHTKNKQKMLAEAVSNNSKDEFQRKDIQNSVANLETVFEKTFVPSINAAKRDPNNPVLKKIAEDGILGLKDAVVRVSKASAVSPHARMLHNVSRAQELQDKLLKAALAGDKAQMSALFKDYQQPILQHLAMARGKASELDEEKRREVEKLSSEIEGLLSELDKALFELAANPDSKEARAKVDAIFKKIDEKLLRIAQILNPEVEKTIVENSEILAKDLEALVSAVKRADELEANLALKRVTNKATEQAVLARMMGTNLESGLTETQRKAVPPLITAFQAVVPDLSVLAPSLLSSKTYDKLLQTVDKTKTNNKSLAEIAKSNQIAREKRIHEEEEKAKEVAREKERKEREEREKRQKAEEERLKQEKLEAEERRKREEELAKQHEAEDTNKDDVHLAAKEVRLKAESTIQKLGSVFGADTTEGKLFAATQKVGELMEKLSDASLRGSTADMIKYAREIVAASNQVMVYATELAKKCTDPILREQLLTQAQLASNTSVQLKIIAAVKATTDEKDGNAKHVKFQLVKCAKLLSNALVKTLTAAEIAAIKSKK